MIGVAAGPTVWHVAGIGCWCRPRPFNDPHLGWVWAHRNVILRPDVQYRCFQSVALGPPV